MPQPEPRVKITPRRGVGVKITPRRDVLMNT
jgi:hypothetical protein